MRYVDEHIRSCARCRSLLQGMQNVRELLQSPKALSLAPALSKRLYSSLDRHIDSERTQTGPRMIPMGMAAESVPLGSHLIYFWESQEDFERGVSFLYPGLGKGDHCILFGHDEALTRALDVLRSKGHDPDELMARLDLTVLRRRFSAQETLAEIGAVVEAAVRSGARAVRFLGNLGVGKDPLPAGENDVIDLEHRASLLIAPFPCVIVCMYDVRALSGQLIMRGGLQSHSLAIGAAGVCKNPYFVEHLEPTDQDRIQ